MRTFLHAQQTQWAVDNDMKKLAADQLPYLPAASRSWMRRTARAMLLVLLTQTVLPAFAQSLPLTANTQAPAGQRPILDAAANGVPIVHIAPPSAAGVSRNQYDQFNVNTNGLILNNSAANVQTAQGGWISGNPQLGATPARIILNEVVSTHASQLRGTIEVAGRRADIVVANPNGIACDGCGFLNSGRATLTTGRPQFGGDGALNGFDVRQGELNIGAGGLNASNLEQLDLIARGIVIEGEVWAKNLNAIAGGNQVLYGTLHSTAQGTAGTAPKFAIDIKSVGGMYANQIYMIGTEQGLGVNSAGRLAALQGNLVLSANGDLTLQETYAKKNIQIDSAGNVKLAGQTMSEGSIAVTTAGQLDNHGVTDALERLKLHSASLNNTGTLVQRGADNATLSVTGQLRNSGTLYSAGQLDMSAASISDLNGRMQISGDLRLQAQQIELTGTQIATNGSAWLEAGAGITAQQSDIHAAADLNATAGTAIVNMNGTWQAAGNASIAGAMFTNLNSTVLVNGHLNVTASGSMANNNSKLLAGRNLALAADSLTNDGGQIVTDTNGSVHFGRALTNENGIISAKNGLQIATIGGSINNTGGVLVSDAALFIAGGELNNTGGVIASGGQQNGALSINVSGISNRYGTVDAAGTLNVRSTDVIDNTYGVLQSGSNSAVPDGSARIESALLLNNGGGILARDTLAVVSGELNNDHAGTQQGRIASAAGNVSVQAAQASNVGGLITAAGESALRTQSLNNTGGEISAGTLLSLDTGNSELLNDGGKLLAGGNLGIRAGAISNKARSGTAASIAAAGNVSIQGASLSNDGASVSAGQSASIVVDTLSNLGGAIEAQGLIAVSANLLDNRAGAVIANDAVSLEAQSVDNTDGVISADKAVSVNSAGALVNARGQIVSNGSVAIVAASLANSAGVVSAKESHVQLGAGVLDNMQGQLIGSQALAIQSGEIRNAAGMIASGTDLALDTQGQSLDNAGGQILADGELRIDSARLYNSAGSLAAMAGKLTIDTHGQDLVNNDGKLQAQGDLSLAAGSFLNQKGVVAGQQVTARTGSFDNGAGEVTAGGDLEITSQALRNDAGLLQATGKVTIDTQGQSLVNINSGSGGGIVAGGELSIAAGSLDNKTGFVGSDGSQTITVAGTLDNRAEEGQASEIVANANSTIIAANVLNSGGRISTLGDLAVTTRDLDNRAGRMTAGGEVALALTTLDNSVQGTAGGAIDAKNISVNATSIDNKGGVIRADNDAAINTPTLTNVGGNITAKANLSVAAASLSNTGGKLVGDAGVTITTSSVSPGGTIASANNVTLNIGGNYSNSGLLSAQRNLTLNAANITNTGTLTAGDVLTANTGSFTNSGEISAYTTNLNVNDTLTSTVSGLIDGVYTNINAGTINNTGRIYGDVLKTKGNTVNNSGTGVIAARDNLLISARNVNNTDGGLLYSLGDIAMAGSFDGNLNAVGEVQKLVNGSAKIEAANNIRLAVKDLINRNDGLVTRTETTSIPVNRVLIQRYASSDLTKYDRATLGWNSDRMTMGRYGGYALPSTTYPFATFGSTPKEDAFVADWESGAITGLRYTVTDPIWALMGVAPPKTSDLSPVAPTLPNYWYCAELGETVCRDYETWQQRMMAQGTALNAKITAFNNDLYSRSFNDWYEDTITRQDITETIVDSTRPAQILAGGAISVASSGSVLNDNSNIVAGGAIGITGASVENRGTEGTKSVTDVGTRIIRYVATFGNGGDLHMGSLGPITGAPVVTTKTLQSFVYQSNGVNPTTSRGLNTQTTGPSGAKSETPQGASGQSRTINVVAVNTSLPTVTTASNADTAAPTIQTIKLAGVGAQAPSLVLTTLPRMSAPSNSLFVLHPQPGARYLVETDSRFTNYRTFLSSDYFLQTLNRDPERQLKRYGDGFYEQQLVNDQILALTGRRYLSGYSDTQSEYQALMDAGIAFARQYQLSPGVALTAEQMALLTTDIVWLTTQTVALPDGTNEQVLVPQVYLRRPQEGDLLPSGGLIAGSDVYIKSAGDLVNSGQISANNETTLLAGSDLLNRGGRISGQDVYARAGNDLKNISGSIQGAGTGSNVALSAGRDIILETRTIAGQTARTATTAATTRVNADRIATVQGGTVTIEAARDLIGKGSAVQADTDLIAVAGRDLKISAVESSYTYNEKTGSRVTKGRSGYIKEESVTHELATFDAGNNIALTAGVNEKGAIALKGVNINADNDVTIQGTNVAIEAVKDSRLADFQTVGWNSYYRAMESDETIVGGTVSAGNNLTVRAAGEPATANNVNGISGTVAGTGNVRLAGVALNATNGQVTVAANNDVIAEAMVAQDSTASEYYKKSKSLFRSKTVIDNRYTDSTEAKVTSLNSANGAVTVTAGNNLLLEGTQINANEDTTLYAGNQLLAVAAHDTYSETIDKQKWKSGIFTSFSLIPIRPETRGAGNGKTTVTHTAQGATITSAEGDVTLYGVGAVGLEGARLAAAQGNVGVVGGVVDIRAATDASSITTTHTEKGAKINMIGWSDPSEGIGRKTKQTSSIQQTTLARTTVDGENIRIAATGGDVHVAGTTITTPGTLTLDAASGTVAFDGQQTEITTSTESSKKDLMYQKVKGKGGTEQVTEYSKISAGAVVVEAPKITAQIGSKDSVLQLAVRPGMDWVNQITKDGNAAIDWKAIEDISSKWDYKAQGLTPEGAVVVTVLVAYFTWGAAQGAGTAVKGATSSVLGSTGSVIAGGATTAAVSALATQAAIAVANNPTDPGAALKELGSSDNIKGLIAAMVTGGVLAGLGLSPTKEPTAGGGAQKFTVQLGQNLQAGVAKAVINTAVYGGSLESNLQSSLMTAFIDTAAAQGAHAIGDMKLDSLTNKIAHAMAGCAAGAASAGSDGCAAGALGAAMGEIAAEGYGARSDTVQFAAMISGMAAAVAGLDAQQINIASQLGANAAANNYLKHAQAKQLSTLIAKQQSGRCDDACATQINDLKELDEKLNRELKSCDGIVSVACDTARAEVRKAAAEYVRKNIDTYDFTYRTEEGETLALAESTMSEVNSAKVIGYLNTVKDGLFALAGVLRSGYDALIMQDPQAQQQVKDGVGSAWNFVSDPANWPELMGALSQTDREKLAYAYETGDGKTVGDVLGAQLANLPIGGGGLGTIKKIDTLIEAAEKSSKLKQLAVKGVVDSEGTATLMLPGLNRPVRSINPDFPPTPKVLDAMSSPNLQKMKNEIDCVDCSEIAGRLLTAAGGKGQVLEVRPAQQGNLNVFENGTMSQGQYYHQVYTDGRYIYDPRLSNRPIPQGDWEQHIRRINPSGVTITNELKGLR